MFFQTVKAQNFVEPSVIVNGRIYICTKIPYQNTMYVHNEDFEATTPPTRPQTMDCQLPTLDYPLIEQKIREVFNVHRFLALKSEGGIGSMDIFIVPTTGQVTSVKFILDTGSSVTREEIYQLENKMKSIILPQPSSCHVNTLLRGEHPIIW